MTEKRKEIKIPRKYRDRPELAEAFAAGYTSAVADKFLDAAINSSAAQAATRLGAFDIPGMPGSALFGLMAAKPLLREAVDRVLEEPTPPTSAEPTCSKCGAGLDVDVEVEPEGRCTACGRDVGLDPSPAAPSSSPAQSSSPACPKCGSTSVLVTPRAVFCDGCGRTIPKSRKLPPIPSDNSSYRKTSGDVVPHPSADRARLLAGARKLAAEGERMRRSPTLAADTAAECARLMDAAFDASPAGASFAAYQRRQLRAPGLRALYGEIIDCRRRRESIHVRLPRRPHIHVPAGSTERIPLTPAGGRPRDESRRRRSPKGGR